MPTSTSVSTAVCTDLDEKPAERDAAPGDITFQAALDARRGALAAMSEERILRRARLDVVTVSAMASGAASKVRELHGELVEEYGPRATELIDGLETTARAARQAESLLEGTEDASELQSLHQEVAAQHERLVIDADSLVVRGFLGRERLAGFRDTRSHQGALSSLLGVVNVLRDAWASIAAHTPIVPADLDRAEAVASRMSTALTCRQTSSARAAAAELRVRALSLLVREYEQLRRMVTYVRWFEGDADSFVPSLYSGRGGRRPKEEPEVDTDAAVTPVPGPVPNNGGGPFSS